jgi:protein tyrosine phosphatase (PTP) superfamily phosphohydrolase (DUF442 family)
MQITQLDAQTYVGPQISIANLNDLKEVERQDCRRGAPRGRDR